MQDTKHLVGEFVKESCGCIGILMAQDRFLVLEDCREYHRPVFSIRQGLDPKKTFELLGVDECERIDVLIASTIAGGRNYATIRSLLAT